MMSTETAGYRHAGIPRQAGEDVKFTPRESTGGADARGRAVQLLSLPRECWWAWLRRQSVLRPPAMAAVVRVTSPRRSRTCRLW